MAEALSAPSDAAPEGGFAHAARAWAARLEAAAVVAAALVALLFWIRLPGTMPSDEDWRDAAADVERRAGPGDAVLLDPHWAERARLFVRGLTVLDLGARPTRLDVERHARLFVLSLPDLPRSDREATFRHLGTLGFARVDGPVAHGRVSVAVFENGHVEVPSFDFTAAVSQARVYIRRADGGEETCPRRGDHHPCPRAGWLDVNTEIREIAFKPRRCVWAHPAGREPLVVEYEGVPLEREIRIVGGIVGQIAFRREGFGTTTLEVKIDGRKVADLAIPAGLVGTEVRRVDTAALSGGSHLVQFEVSAENPGMRHFCFDAGVYP